MPMGNMIRVQYPFHHPPRMLASLLSMQRLNTSCKAALKTEGLAGYQVKVPTKITKDRVMKEQHQEIIRRFSKEDAKALKQEIDEAVDDGELGVDPESAKFAKRFIDANT